MKKHTSYDSNIADKLIFGEGQTANLVSIWQLAAVRSRGLAAGVGQLAVGTVQPVLGLGYTTAGQVVLKS